MRILFDTNVVLDVLLDRRPHTLAAARLMAKVHDGAIEGLLGATTLTTIYYLAAKTVGTDAAHRHVAALLSMFEVGPIGRPVLSDALATDFSDYEGAVLHEAARHAGATGIVTRDARGFATASLPVYTPPELLRLVHALP